MQLNTLKKIGFSDLSTTANSPQLWSVGFSDVPKKSTCNPLQVPKIVIKIDE